MAFLSKQSTASLGQPHHCTVLLPISLMMVSLLVQGLPTRSGVYRSTQEHWFQKCSLLQSRVISVRTRTRHTLRMVRLIALKTQALARLGQHRHR